MLKINIKLNLNKKYKLIKKLLILLKKKSFYQN